MVGFDAQAVGGLHHGDDRGAGEQFGQNAFVRGIEVLNEYVRESGVGRELAEQLRECVEAARRRSNRDNTNEARVVRLACVCGDDFRHRHWAHCIVKRDRSAHFAGRLGPMSDHEEIVTKRCAIANSRLQERRQKRR